MIRSNTEQITPSWNDVTARRLVRQGLDVPSQAMRPADIVRTLCGAHAQVLSAALWSIGLRSASLTESEVRDALWIEHSLVKTFGPLGIQMSKTLVAVQLLYTAYFVINKSVSNSL